MIEFRVLGPLEASHRGQAIPLGGPRQRALLAYLLLRANTAVSAEELVDALWPGHDAEAGKQALRVAISRLRTALGGETVLATRPPGYELLVSDEQLDLRRFHALTGEAERAFDAEDWAGAATRYEAALGLWRGPPLADVAGDGLGPDIDRLEELRLSATERHLDAELALGRDAALVAELDGLVERHPYRERLRRQHMLALYRSGRQAEALESYREARRRLVGELGIEPSHELQELERAILRQDVEPGPRRHEPSPPHAVDEPGRRRAVIAVVSAAVIAVGAGLAYALVGRASSPPVVATVAARTNSLVILDERSGRTVGNVSLGGLAGELAVGAGAVWALLPSAAVVVHVDPADSTRAPIGVPPDPIGISAGAGGVWVADRWNTITRLDPSTGTVDPPIRLAPERVFPNMIADVTTTRDAVWLASRDTAEAARYSVRSARLRNHLGDGGGDDAFFYGAGTSVIGRGLGDVWLTNRIDNAGEPFGGTTHSGRVTRIEAATGRVLGRFTFASAPRALAAARDAVWIAVADRVWRLGRLETVASRDVRVPAGPIALAADASGAWVATRDRQLLQIDPAGGRVVKRWRLDKAPRAVAVGYGRVWVAVGSRD